MHILVIVQPRPSPLFCLSVIVKRCARIEVDNRGRIKFYVCNRNLKEMSNIDVQQDYLSKNRSCHPEVFYKTFVLKHYARLTGKHLCCNLFCDKVVNIKSLTSLKQNFVFCEFAKFFLMNLVIIWNFLLLYFLEDNSLEFMESTSQSPHFFIILIHSLCFITSYWK